MAGVSKDIIEFGATSDATVKRVLNAGSGPPEAGRLHAAFRHSQWAEVRYDIDQLVKPDIIGSIVDMSAIKDDTFDAIWCSHNLEHLHTHDVPNALREFRRVLRPDGFALMCSPDLEAIAEIIVDGRVDDVAYQSPAGPIRALDMLYGLSSSIRSGNLFMAHHTGFTADRLGRLLIENGFAEAFTKRGNGFDVWALGFMPESNQEQILRDLKTYGADLYPDPA